MTRFLIAAALALGTTAAASAPVDAVAPPGVAGSTAATGVTVHRGGSSPFAGDGRFMRDRDRSDRRRGFNDVGYLAVPEYQGDSAFRSEGFNDWWHSRPDRSEPRWLRSNNCERQYWTGGGWRC